MKKALLERARRIQDYSAAAHFLLPEEPEEALRLVARAGQVWEAAALGANCLLGVRHRPYAGEELGPIDPEAGSTPLGRRILESAKEIKNPLYHFVLGDILRNRGAKMYAAGQLDWDYTATANAFLQRALDAEPGQPNCGFDRAMLPPRGAKLTDDPPVAPLRLIREGPSVYPPEARDKRIEGRVAFWALIGCSGRVIALDSLGGPPELQDAAARKFAGSLFTPYARKGQARQVIHFLDTTFSLR